MVTDMYYPVIKTTISSMATTFERQHSTKMPRHRTKRYTRKVLHNHIQERSPFSYAYRSVANDRHPMRNEDSILIDEQTGLVAVFDGVGGEELGLHFIADGFASFFADEGDHFVAALAAFGGIGFGFGVDENQSAERFGVFARVGERDVPAHEQVRIEGAKRAGTDDLATTVALAAFCKQPEAREYIMISAHVGDSRIYLLRGQEKLQRITNDDGLLTKLVENQIVDELHAYQIDQATQANQLSDMDYRYFRLRGGITQAIGGPTSPTVHTNKTTIYPSDRLLLCTDGIHDNLTDEEIEDVLRNTPRPAFARRLVELSQQRSRQDYTLTIRAKPDDISAIVVTCRF